MYNVTCLVLRKLSETASKKLIRQGFSTKTKGEFTLLADHPSLTASHMTGQFELSDKSFEDGLVSAFTAAVKAESLQHEIQGFVYVSEDSDDFDNHYNQSRSYAFEYDGKAEEDEDLRKCSLRETLSSHFALPENVDAFNEVGLGSVRFNSDIIESNELKRCEELKAIHESKKYDDEKSEFEKLDEQSRIEKILDGTYDCDFVEKFYNNSRLKELILKNVTIKRSLW